jgi:hypothetical protein
MDKRIWLYKCIAIVGHKPNSYRRMKSTSRISAHMIIWVYSIAIDLYSYLLTIKLREYLLFGYSSNCHKPNSFQQIQFKQNNKQLDLSQTQPLLLVKAFDFHLLKGIQSKWRIFYLFFSIFVETCYSTWRCYESIYIRWNESIYILCFKLCLYFFTKI